MAENVAIVFGVVIAGTAVWYFAALGLRIGYLFRHQMRLNNLIYEIGCKEISAGIYHSYPDPRRVRWGELERRYKRTEWFMVWRDYESMYPTDYILYGKAKEPSR